MARDALAAGGPVEAVGITNQRASTVVWDGRTGEPVGPGIGWQDLRTVGTCLMLQAEGLRLSPNESATKLAYLLDTDATSASTPGSAPSTPGSSGTSPAGPPRHRRLQRRRDRPVPPGRAGGWCRRGRAAPHPDVGPARHRRFRRAARGRPPPCPARPPLCALAGDQQASLIGQGCTRPGLAKATFGTGAMLDVCAGLDPPGLRRPRRGRVLPDRGLAARGRAHLGRRGDHAVRRDRRRMARRRPRAARPTPRSPKPSPRPASDTGGVVSVPALLGLGTPHWDFGARGALLGLTRGTGRPEVVRAVLEGVAHRGADLLEAAELDAGSDVDPLRIDGGMSANSVFVQALANACGRPVEISPELEATTLGAAYLAGMAIGTWTDEDEVAETWSPRAVVEPTGRPPTGTAGGRPSSGPARWYPGASSALQF